MSIAQRRLIGLGLGLLVFGSTLIVSVNEMRRANRRGWVGVAFMAMPSDKVSRKQMPFGFHWGDVILAFPDGPADRAGVQSRDTIETVNGVPLTDIKGLSRLDDRLHRGDLVTYRVVRNGRRLDIPVRLVSPLRSPLYLPSLVIGFMVAVVFLVIGSIVFFRRPDDRRVVVFYAMTVIAAVYMSTYTVLGATNEGQRGITGQQTIAAAPQIVVTTIAVLLFAPLLLHLALVFPKPRAIVVRFPEIFGWLYGLPFTLLAGLGWGLGAAAFNDRPAIGIPLLAVAASAMSVAAVRIARRMKREGKDAIWRSPLTAQVVLGGAAGAIFALSLVSSIKWLALTVTVLEAVAFIGGIFAYAIATVIALYRSYRESGVEEKRQVKWPLWAIIVVVVLRIACGLLGAAFSMMAVFSGRRLLTGTEMQLTSSIPHLLYVLIPIAFAFAIAKYRLMNIDLIIRRTVVYGILTAVVFVIYGALVAGLGTLLVKFAGVHNQTMVIASTIVVALIAVPLRNRLQTVVDRNVFRERVDYPLALRTISGAVDRGDSREALLRVTAEQLQQALQNAFVLLVLRSDQHFVATAKVGVADEVLGTFRVPVSNLDLSRPIDVQRDAIPPELAHRLRRLDAKLLVPMRAQRASLGFVVLGAKLSSETFSRDDIEFVDGAASQLAFALESSRMKSEEEDFDDARAMQQVLLPKSLPQPDGFALAGMWQPARSVGGDYYDAIPLADGKVGICIADVAGKGMPAALLMAGLQAAVKATASSDMAPRRLCGRVRQVLMPNLTGGKFITFFYAVLDTAARTLTYCNAGHNPPLLVRASGAVEPLAAGGTVLGRLFAGDPYDEATVTLDRGDRVVLFTDGVTEARRGDEDFGEGRLADVIRAHRGASAAELQERIIEAITAFTSGSFGDDVTLVIIAAQ